MFDAVGFGANRACDEPQGVAGEVLGGRPTERGHETVVKAVDGLDMEGPEGSDISRCRPAVSFL